MRTPILLALLLAACVRVPGAAPTNTASDPRAIYPTASTATSAPAIEPTSFGAELPPLARVVAITRRAHEELRIHNGFLNALSEVQQCYRSLRRHPEIENRVYCLQLDEIACGNEVMTDYSFRRADERYSGYLTEDNCEARQEANAPPFGRAPNTQLSRAQLRRDLETANEQIEEENRRASPKRAAI